MPVGEVLRVFTIGDRGVNRFKTPLKTDDDELISAQNAEMRRDGSRHALAKRRGIGAFTDALAGTVFAVVNGGSTLPPAPPTPVDEDDEDATATFYGSQHAALLDEAYMRCRLYLSAATTSINDNAVTAISWTAEDFDVGNMHDLSTNPDRVTIPSNGDGLYLVIGQVKWATAGSAPKRGITLFKNNAVVYGNDAAGDDDGDSMYVQCVALMNLVATDYISMKVEQDTGGALDAMGGSVDETSITVMRIIQTVNTPLPRCHAFLGSNQTFTHNTPAVVSFDSESVDNSSMHDNVTNNSRITIPADHDGLYLCAANFEVDATFVGYVVAEIYKNGSQVLHETRAAGINTSSGSDVSGQVSGAFEMSAGDYFELRITIQLNAGSGTHDLVGGASNLGTSMVVARVG